MVTYRYKEFTSCVAGERIFWQFEGIQYLYMNLLTAAGFESYKNKMDSVERHLNYSPCICVVNKGGDTVLVGDLCGQQIPPIKDFVKRFSFEFEPYEMSTMTTLDGKIIVQNAHDTQAEESMIEYWKEQTGRQPDFKCPSCGKIVSRTKLDGAHIHKYRSSKLYIVPLCQSCNRSKVDRYFKVNECDLVPVP